MTTCSFLQIHNMTVNCIEYIVKYINHLNSKGLRISYIIIY